MLRKLGKNDSVIEIFTYHPPGNSQFVNILKRILEILFIVNGMGNPRISPPVPVPVPVKPVGKAMGLGFQWVGVTGFQQPRGIYC
jgi:hypothetical protein